MKKGMKEISAAIIMSILIFSPITSYAFDWGAILKALVNIAGFDEKILDASNAQLDQLKEMQKNLQGRHDFGSQYYDNDAYAWGISANSWQQVLALSRNGGGNGQLGETILALSKDYPIQDNFNSPNEIERDYYRLQAQTSLASRSAAELSYKQAVEQEQRMRALHDLIDQVEDEKSASDLNNRLSSEQAMTSLQQTKLLSILVQQQAINAQERANRAKEDMAFFDK